MKCLLFVILNMLSCASPSFAMDFLDDPLVKTRDCLRLSVKDLRPKFPDLRYNDPRYEDRSAIYMSHYPKMVMVHTYNHRPRSTPCSAAFPHACPPKLLEDYCTQNLADHEKVYSFVVQYVEPHGSNFSLKPQYFVHPDAPLIYKDKDYKTALRWTVVPGAQGQIEPRGGSLQITGLLSDVIYTHSANASFANQMVLSGDVMHLNGLNQIQKYATTGELDCFIPSKDMHSLVAFEDQGRKIAAFTYHWLLSRGSSNDPNRNPKYENSQYDDFGPFIEIVKNANTFRELLTNLEPIPNFKTLLGELKHYVGLTSRIDQIDPELQPTGLAAKIETLPEKFIVTTDYNANANYQLRSNRFAVAAGQTVSVPYNITVAEGSRVSLGLLNTNGNGWYGDELIWVPGSYQGIFERIVPENETTAEVVFRNYHLDAPEQSIFTVNYATVKVDNHPVETQLTPTNTPVHASRKKGPVRVTTDHNANASYQLESKRFPVKGGERIRIPYDITVEDGGIMSLGLLSSSRTWWYPSQVGGETEELILKAGHYYKGIFERIVPEGETVTSLVFRNYHLGTPGQTTFTINDLKIEKTK